MPDKPEWQFRDQTIPARLFYLLKHRKITARDVLLSTVINSLVKPQTDEDGMGCFAENSYLGEAIGSHERYVSSRISHLYNLGLLIIINYQGKRYLEMEWSRTSDEIQDLAGEYGQLFREEYEKLVIRVKKKEDEQDKSCTKPEGKGSGKPEPSGKPEGKVQENLKGRVQENLNHNTIRKKYKGKQQICPPKSADSLVVADGLFEETKPKGFIEKLADYIHSKISIHDPKRIVNKKIPISDSINALRKLQMTLISDLDKSKSEIQTIMKEVIKDHAEHITEQFQPKHYYGTSIEKNWNRIASRKFDRNSTYTNNHHSNTFVESNPIVLSHETKRLLQALNHLQWSNGAGEQLPNAIQISIDNFRDIWKKAKIINAREDGSLAWNYTRIFFGCLQNEMVFIEIWYTKLNEMFNNWPEWSGKLPIVHLQNKYFADECKKFSVEQCGRPDFWYDFLKEALKL